HRGGASPIPRELQQIRLVSLPGDVRGKSIADQYLPLLPRHQPATRGWASGNLTPRVRGPPAVTVGARVDRVVQHEGQRHSVGAAPFQPTTVGTEVRPDRQADLVASQIAQ